MPEGHDLLRCGQGQQVAPRPAVRVGLVQHRLQVRRGRPGGRRQPVHQVDLGSPGLDGGEQLRLLDVGRAGELRGHGLHQVEQPGRKRPVLVLGLEVGDDERELAQQVIAQLLRGRPQLHRQLAQVHLDQRVVLRAGHAAAERAEASGGRPDRGTATVASSS